MNGNLSDLEPFERDWLSDASSPVRTLREARTACPPLHLLRAGLADALPEDLQSALATHLGSCASCRALQDGFRALPPPAGASDDEAQRMLRRVRRDAPPERSGATGFPKWLWWRPELAAAALIIAAAAGARYISSPADPAHLPPASQVPAQMAGPQAAADRQLPLAPAPRGPALDKPPVRLSLAVLTWRGADEGAQRFLADLAPALDAYRAERYAEAAGLFEGLAARYPDAVEIPFYLGVSRLWLDDAAGAAAALAAAVPLADRTFEADVSWYLGIALARAGRGAEARERFSGLCGGTSAYRARACAAVRE